jgi:hypothetical protein
VRGGGGDATSRPSGVQPQRLRPSAVAYLLPIDWAFWQRVDVEHLRRCDAVVVLMLDGWDRSAGVREEVRRAQAVGKTVRFVTPLQQTQTPNG